MATKSLHEVYTDLVSKVYDDDLGSQQYYLSVVQNGRNISVDYLLERGCIFVPNNDYIRHYLGADANTWGCELYRDDTCLWTLYVLIPIMDLAQEVVGLVGWDAQNAYLVASGQADSLPNYKVSSKYVFQKEKYFLSDISLLKRKFDKRTIFITDGVFDSMALNYRGIPAMALLGSTFSREILYFLRWYSRIFVCADNDSAGLRLYQKLRSSLPGVYRVVQSKEKDIEKFIRSEEENGPYTSQLLDALENGIKADVYLK